MKLCTQLCLLALLLPAVCLAQDELPVEEPSVAEESVTIVHAGTLLTVPGRPPLSRQTVVIRDGRVEAVHEGYLAGAALGLVTDAEVIDLSDSFVLPGLTDLHTHVTMELGPEIKLAAVTLTPVDHALNGVVYLERTLGAGFTTIRNVGADPEVIFALRRGVEGGKIAGPRILAAGAGVANTGGHADSHGYLEEILELFESSGICDGGDDCRRAVRAQIKRGSDWVKITATGGVLSETAAGVNQQLFDDELEAIVATARMMGREVAAHAHGTDGINAALRAGVRTIEHGTFADEESFSLFRQQGAYLVPTALAGFTVAEIAKNAEFMPAPIRAKALEVGPQISETVGKAHAAGVRIAFGTDSAVSPHGQNAREFGLLVAAGMSEMEAIVSATVTAAEVLGRSGDLGTIEPGKRADLIATPGSPLDDIGELLNVTFVMKDGVVFKDESSTLPVGLAPRGSR